MAMDGKPITNYKQIISFRI